MERGFSQRISSIDFARGIALCLMILSHGVKGLLSFDQFPEWGLVPIHLLTKFSSTLFFLVFGISLAVSFAPTTLDPSKWKLRRRKLWFRALTILFWYKILTIIEMSHLFEPHEILNALLYLDFPSYSEILGFYAIALLWIPLLLPLWQRSSLLMKAFWPLAFIGLSAALRPLDFQGLLQLKAILIEDESFYTWGQLSRAPFVFLGMFLGTFYASNYFQRHSRFLLSLMPLAGALGCFLSFYLLYGSELRETLFSLAVNEGKHPPELSFILFSLGGALLITGLSILGGEKLAHRFSLITLIGTNSLSAFVFHLGFIFIALRLTFNLWLKVTYPEALMMSILLIFLTAGWIQFNKWRQNYEGSQVSHRHRRDPRDLNARELPTN